MKKLLFAATFGAFAASSFAGFVEGNLTVLYNAGTSSSSANPQLREYSPITAAQASAVSSVNLSSLTTDNSATSGGLSVYSETTSGANRWSILVGGWSSSAETQGRIAKYTQDAGSTLNPVVTYANVSASNGDAFRQVLAGSLSTNAPTIISSGPTTYRFTGPTFSSTPGSSTSNSNVNTSTRGVAFRPNGEVFVTTSTGYRTLTNTQTGTLTLSGNTSISGANDLLGLVFTGQNTFYAVDQTDGLYKGVFNSGSWTTSFVRALGTGAGTSNGGSWLATNTAGTELYITTAETSNNRLLRLTDLSASNPTISVLANPGNAGVFRGVVAVPEPASMAVLGIGLAGLVSRRRRK